MRKLFLPALISTMVLFAHAQVSRHYRYQYSIKGETIELNLLDSTIINKNAKQHFHTVKRFTQKDKKTISQQIYVSRSGKDSIRKWFDKDKLIKVEEFKYDSQGRLASSSVKDLLNAQNSSAAKYIFVDSITTEGKVTTMMAFRTYARMLNSLDYTLKTYYNKAGDTLRVMRKDINGEKDIYPKNRMQTKRTANTIVYRQETSIDKKELQNQPKLITKYITSLKPKLKDPKYISLDYTFFTPDSTIQVVIKKNRRENVQRAEIKVND